jgi:5-methylcytosine-specific restriction endonuclease McrA
MSNPTPYGVTVAGIPYYTDQWGCQRLGYPYENAQIGVKKYRNKNGASKKAREQIKKRDGYRCRSCPSTDDLCIDHIIPVKHGGKHTPDNLQTLCRSCNSKKGTKHA